MVAPAGKTMDEIVSAIQRVSDIVAEISSASQEQSSGVQQVGDAVSQMDQATQQNAALVEESAAAAENLRSQAQQLVQAVSVFRTANDGTRPAGGFSSEPAANAAQIERRSPDRATNVTRPALKGKAANLGVGPAPAKQVASAKTGTDDWDSF